MLTQSSCIAAGAKGVINMGKKKQETLQDVIDRIEEDLISLREKAEELEDNQCECPDEDEDLDEDSDEDSD